MEPGRRRPSWLDRDRGIPAPAGEGGPSRKAPERRAEPPDRSSRPCPLALAAALPWPLATTGTLEVSGPLPGCSPARLGPARLGPARLGPAAGGRLSRL